MCYLLELAGFLAAAVKSNGLKEGDLVILTLRRPADNDHRASGAVNALAPEKRVFGYVRQTQRYNLRSSEQLHPLISEFNFDSTVLC